MIRHLLLMSGLGGGCTDDCSGRGECWNGTCLCEIRYSGDICDGPNFPYHAGIGGGFLLVALVCAIMLMMNVISEYQRLKAPTLLRACRVTTQKLLYFLAFLACLIRGAYFISPDAFRESWTSSLLSAFYPILMTGSSIIVCYWAEVFHLRDIRWETPQFLSKSFLGFVTFNIINYSLLLAEFITTQIANTSIDDRNFFTHIFNGCYAVLLFIVVIFFLIYGIEVYFKVRGGFLRDTVTSIANNRKTSEDITGETAETQSTLFDKEFPSADDLHQEVNTSQLHQSRFGLLSQAFMLIIIVGFLFSETLSEFWKKKVPVYSRNWHDLVFRIVEIGVALWFPCVLWNCMSPAELWILNPRKLITRLDKEPQPIENDNEKPGPSSGEGETFLNKKDCWICYDSDKNEPLIQPCQCTGDVSSVHHDCLKRWLMESSANADSHVCNVCGYKYNVQHTTRLDWGQGFTSQHWGSTAVIVTCMCVSVAGAWVVIQLFEDPYIRMTSASIALLVIYVCISRNMDLKQIFVLLLGLYQLDQTKAFLSEFYSENKCGFDEISCDGGKCINKIRRCDGTKDCEDSTDEFNCDQILCKEPNYFLCENQRCISSSFVCDTENDCGDNSDEKNCTNYEISVNHVCSENEWQCADHLCIPKEWVCNDESDCLDGSDETIGCSAKIECDGFKCHNNHCIPIEWHCDNRTDCTDGSDELNCELVYEPKDCTIDHRKFLCKNNVTCIDMKLLCDNIPQCPDHSDENSNCNATENQCSLHNCSHECVQTPDGPLCLCPKGYHQIADKQCVDINECEIYGICDQKCKNTEGSYECFCDKKYSLQDDKRTCKVNGGEAVMLFSSKNEIRAFFLTSKFYYSVAKKLKQAVGVSFDGTHVYWTDIHIENEAIVRSDEDGSNRELLVRSGLGAPEDLAVDWITGNIYFTDAEMQFIGVCSNDGSKCTILVNEDIDKPRGIVLNPHEGEMFWSDWGKKPEIAKSSMDGSNDISFVSNKIYWPNGLTIDYPNQRLYWVDAKLMTIESILLDGTDRRVILSEVAKHPYGIAIFEDKLYWSDWATHSIQYCDKFTGKNHHTLIKEKKEFIYGLHIFHSALKQRINNPCKDSFCSDICLLNKDSYSCACPQDKTLSADKRNCKQTEKIKLMAAGAGDLLMLIQHQTLGKHDINILPSSFSQINYLTYNSVAGTLIVSDKLQHKIYSVDLTTKESQVLVSTEIGEIGGMDFDYFTNNLYWCDSKFETVEIMSLENKERKTILNNLAGEIPLDLALVPEEGVMFIAFKKPEKGVHIDRIHMDGQGGRTHVVEQGLVGPILSLTYDHTLKRIFWSDSHTGNIESTSVDGDDRHAFRSLMTDPVSIAVLSNDLFWTNSKSKRIFWADKHNDRHTYDKKITLDISKDIDSMYLTAISGIRTDTHPCLKDNWGCSHICLQSLKEPLCVCPSGQILSSDNKTCFTPKHCNSNEYKCTTTEICISKDKRCDGRKDCLHGDDEDNCVKERRCPLRHFECMNGECISENKVCDLHYDCRDKSDELNCNEDKEEAPKCPLGAFRCKDGKCIAERMRCDNIQDCNDGTDEENCHLITCSYNEYRCKSGECIPKTWECDHESDCQDGSDEHEHCGPVTCNEDAFTCNNGRCVDKELLCNLEDDCGDFSDEIDCKSNKTEILSCSEEEFLCNINSTICLPEIARCNGTSECSNGEDERNCKNCQTDEFECKNNKCITQAWVCDKHDDCGDKSDEEPKLCDKNAINHTITHISFERQSVLVPCEHGFRCKTGHCIEMNMVCNGIENCYDGSDEYGSCETACEVNNNPCVSICWKTPSGPRCSCQDGYKLKGDAQTCEDINECEKNPSPCSQLCENSPGSFSCGCYQGYELRSDKLSCKAIGSPMYIIFSSRNEIRKLSPAINTLDLINSDDNPRITGLDISINKDDLYFSLEDIGMIRRTSLKTNRKDHILGLGNPQKLAVDWITDNIYFVDAQPAAKTMKVCHIQERKCAKILELSIHDQISSLVVDAVNKYIFYSTTSWWLFSTPKSAIFKCNLDGSKVHELVRKDLGHVTGITYDYNKKILYFSDQNNNQIQAVDYEGNNRHVVLTDTYVHYPMGLNLFEDHIYFLTPNGYLVKCKIYGLQNICSPIKLHAFTSELFILAQESKQPIHENICANHNCSHLCIQSEVGRQCVCEDGNIVREGTICHTKMRDSLTSNKQGIIFELGQANIQNTKTSHSIIGSTLSAIVITLLIIASAATIYKYIRSKKTGKFDVSMRFLNPAYGMTIPDSVATNNNSLQPGQHEYSNPVLINAQDMQSAASVILQKAKQNPFVLADSANSDSEVASSCDNKKLINF